MKPYQGILAFIGYLLLQFIVSALISMEHYEIIAGLIALIAFGWLLYKKQMLLISSRDLKGSSLLLCLGIGLGVALFFKITILFAVLSGEPVSEQPNPTPFFWMEYVAAKVILIPVVEELLFRGILFKRFRERQRFWYSAVCSSVFFMFIHTNTTQMVYAFLLGLMLAYLYEKTGSVKAPVLLHIMMNAGSVVFTETGVFGWLGADPARMVPAVIGGAFICSAVFVKIQRITDSGKPEPPQDAPGPLDMFR